LVGGNNLGLFSESLSEVFFSFFVVGLEIGSLIEGRLFEVVEDISDGGNGVSSLHFHLNE